MESIGLQSITLHALRHTHSLVSQQYQGFIGGSTWESNPPMTLLTPHSGFEDRKAHQHLSTPVTQL